MTERIMLNLKDRVVSALLGAQARYLRGVVEQIVKNPFVSEDGRLSGSIEIPL
jgi:hypothetical protein